MNSGAGGAVGILVIIFLVGYFIPSIIALSRGHKDGPAIIAVNLLLGWSILGWFVSLIWSLADPRGRAAAQTVVIHNTAQNNHTAPIPAPASTPVVVTTGDDADVIFWDRSSNKTDPDFLEEYLVRFPSGRFSELAHGRLARLRGPEPEARITTPAPPLSEVSHVEPAAAVVDEVAPPLSELSHVEPTEAVVEDVAPPKPANDCVACGTGLAAEARFCEECGAEVQEIA